MAEWRDNHGTQPSDTKGKRMAVELHGGVVTGFDQVSNGAPYGWPANESNWTVSKRPKPFEIKRFKLLG
jgi:hypothetical protein